MSDTQPTITVETKNGLVQINKSDYDANPKNFKLAKGQKVEEPAETAEELAAKEAEKQAKLNARSVNKVGSGKKTRFIVIDGNGDQVGEEEYETEAEAIAAAFPTK